MPFKSESMGLLDAEGYKFLEASDSNSDEGGNAERTSPENRKAANTIYEMRPAPLP